MSMRKCPFKIGDTVRCILSDGRERVSSGWELNKEFVIEHIHETYFEKGYDYIVAPGGIYVIHLELLSTRLPDDLFKI